jgi:transposase-like protein
MNSTYPEGFIEQALVKVFSRGKRSVRLVAEDLNVNYHTLKNWMKRPSVDKLGVKMIKEKRPQADL